MKSASSAEKGRELHSQLMTYEIDSHALSTAESGSTERDGCDMTIMSEKSCSCTCHVRIFRGNGYFRVLRVYMPVPVAVRSKA